MRKRQTQKILSVALANVNETIRMNAAPTNGNNFFAAGLAREGYAGGYADCLMDMQLVLNGINPKRQMWWDNIDPDNQIWEG